MSQPGTMPAALAALPLWWQETTETTTLDATLASWVRACGWRAGGFTWPAEGTPTVQKASPNHGTTEAVGSTDVIDVVRRVRTGEPTAVVSLPSGASRVYAPVMCPGKPLGLLWADRPANQAWTDADLAYLALTARALERSPVIAAA